jgi:hypothetical protein
MTRLASAQLLRSAAEQLLAASCAPARLARVDALAAGVIGVAAVYDQAAAAIPRRKQ